MFYFGLKASQHFEARPFILASFSFLVHLGFLTQKGSRWIAVDLPPPSGGSLPNLSPHRAPARECAVPQQQEVLFHTRRRELLLQCFLQPIRSLPRLAGGSACKADGGARSGESHRQLPRALPRALCSLYTRKGRAGRPPAPESHRWGLLVVVKESRR